jgi:hypothetical protein
MTREGNVNADSWHSKRELDQNIAGDFGCSDTASKGKGKGKAVCA